MENGCYHCHRRQTERARSQRTASRAGNVSKALKLAKIKLFRSGIPSGKALWDTLRDNTSDATVDALGNMNMMKVMPSKMVLAT